MNVWIRPWLAIALVVAQGAAPPAAIVSSLNGRAWIVADGARRAVTPYDWLPAGAEVEVEPGGAVTLIIIDGHRFTLGAGARVRLTAGDPVVLRGPVSPGAQLPALPDLPPIASAAPRESAAVRIRGGVPSALYPCEGTRALADATQLRFEPPHGADRFDIRVRTPDGATVFFRVTGEPRVAVPPGTLRAGTQYDWTVRQSGGGVEAERGATLTTLDPAAAARRAAARDALVRERSFAVLAAVDRRLGLLAEAIEELEQAVAQAPDDRSAARALEEARATIARQCR